MEVRLFLYYRRGLTCLRVPVDGLGWQCPFVGVVCCAGILRTSHLYSIIAVTLDRIRRVQSVDGPHIYPCSPHAATLLYFLMLMGTFLVREFMPDFDDDADWGSLFGFEFAALTLKHVGSQKVQALVCDRVRVIR